MCDLAAFNASSRARLATIDGASSTRCRSFAGGVTRVKCLRLTRVLVGSISWAISVYQDVVCSYHSRFPCVFWPLLMYTHSYFALSAYCVVVALARSGVDIGARGGVGFVATGVGLGCGGVGLVVVPVI